VYVMLQLYYRILKYCPEFHKDLFLEMFLFNVLLMLYVLLINFIISLLMTSILGAVNSSQYCSLLQTDTDSISNLSAVNYRKLNMSKCKAIYFIRKN
jgi:hypothetical protein